MQKIRRNATYYTDRTKQNHWCASCYLDLDENSPVVLEDGSNVRKAALQKLKNDGIPEEAWVQCDDCNDWVHQICALFNGRRNKTTAAYLCPKCHIKKTPDGETVEEEKRVKVAKDLPHCKMSVEIEKGLNGILTKACEDRAKELGIDVSAVEKVEGLSVRVISNIEKNHLVRDEVGSLIVKRTNRRACSARK
jgi:E1A/CREB-binding protein